MKPSLFIILAVAVVAGCSGGGVTFTVHNVGAKPLVASVVHVTGHSYPIGDLLPGQTKSVKVDPSGESHIEIEQQGRARLVIDCYMEPGYTGEVAADVTPDAIVNIKNNVKI